MNPGCHDPGSWRQRSWGISENQLKSPIAGLPQPEPAMRVTFVPTETFNGLLRYVRNILVVDIDPTKYTMVSLNGFKDEWAKGQEVIKTLCSVDSRTGHLPDIT